jgi:hypothetical protein
MPLRESPLPLQFSGGIETKQDSKQVPATKLLALENATFIKQTTLAKRNGYEALGRQVDDAGTVISDAVGMGLHDTELLLFTSERGYSYRDSSDTWADAGEVGSVVAEDSPIARTGTHQTVPDHATNGGITVVAWEDSRGGVWCSVIEDSTGRILLAETQLSASGISPRCVPCGTVVHVYFAIAATNRLYVTVINPAAPSMIPVPAILTEDLSSTNPVYDACDAGRLYSNILPAVIAWAQAGGGYRVGYVHPSGVLGSPVSGLPSVATYTETVTGPIAVAPDRVSNDILTVVWCNTAVHGRCVSSSSPVTDATGDVLLTATTGTWNRVSVESSGVSAAGLAQLWWIGEIDDSRDDWNRCESGMFESDGTVIVAPATGAPLPSYGTGDPPIARVLRGHGLVSRAFVDDGHVYAAVGHGVKYFPYVAIVRISATYFGGSTLCFARLGPGQFSGLSTRKHVAYVQPTDPDGAFLSRVHRFCFGYRIQLDSANGDQFGETGIKLAEVDFDHAAAYQSAQLGRGLYLAGACPQHYDGRRWAEAGFHCGPDFAEGVTSFGEGAAGAMAAGTYGYKIVYEEIDAMGEWHPGPESVEFNVTIAASKKVDADLPTYRLTSKRNTRIGVFRSPVNDSSAFYRVTSLDPTDTGDNRFVLNSTVVDVVTFTDNMTDADLVTKEPLYTNGGVISNSPIGIRGDVLAGGKNRLFATDQTDPNMVRYSKELTAEDTAVEWPADLFQRVDPYGGAIVAIGVMDGIVYPFCETSIYRFAGPGPDADGGRTSNNAFTPSELVTSDVGCASANSICQGPVGIFFQSEKGIKLLDRSGQVQDIGAPVYAYNDQTVTRATLLPDRHQVLFLTNDGSTLLYDYERGQWSTFTNHEGVDAVVLNGTYHYLRNDSRVFRETPGLYVDDNSHITMRIETAWIKAAGYLQGFQRILWAYFLGQWKSSHTLGIRFRTDYNDAWSERFELNVDANHNPSLYGDGLYGDGAYGGPGGDTARYQRKLHINRQCQSIQFRIEDIEPTGTYGAAFELSELLLIGGVLGPRYPLSASRST